MIDIGLSSLCRRSNYHAQWPGFKFSFTLINIRSSVKDISWTEDAWVTKTGCQKWFQIWVIMGLHCFQLMVSPRIKLKIWNVSNLCYIFIIHNSISFQKWMIDMYYFGKSKIRFNRLCDHIYYVTSRKMDVPSTHYFWQAGHSGYHCYPTFMACTTPIKYLYYSIKYFLGKKSLQFNLIAISVYDIIATEDWQPSWNPSALYCVAANTI